MILDVLDLHYPLVTFKDVKVKSEWITQDIFELMTQRDDAYTKARQSKREADWTSAHTLRNKVNSLCKNAKNEFTRDKLEKNKLNPRKFWQDLKILWGSSKSKSTEEIILKSNPPLDPNQNEAINNTTTTPASVASQFNQFFTSVAKNIPLYLTQNTKHL